MSDYLKIYCVENQSKLLYKFDVSGSFNFFFVQHNQQKIANKNTKNNITLLK